MTKREEIKSIPITRQMVKKAYKKVKANRGKAGIDQVSLESFQQDLSRNLYKIWNRLTSGSYFPPSVKAVSIRKKDGGKRQLGIPTVGDRIAQQVIKSYLEPRLENQFHENSYGYRPLKSAHQAVEEVRKNVRKYAWVIDMDVSKFFDKMSHELLMKALNRHVEERWVKMYIQRWLEAPVETEGGIKRHKGGYGTPQGGVISPLLANLFLHYALDKWLDLNYPDLSFVRYADDVIIHCKSEGQAKEVLTKVRGRLEECELSLNEKKTKIVYCQDYRREKRDYRVKFDFLGFSFQPRTIKSQRGGLFLGYVCTISTASEKHIVEQFRKLKFHKWCNVSIEYIALRLNPKIRGWINYYGKFNRYALSRVFRRFHYRLMKWVLNRHKRFKHNKRKAFQWLRNMRANKPDLFHHWKVGFKV
jgi:RNA-directed DNA polymerase